MRQGTERLPEALQVERQSSNKQVTAYWKASLLVQICPSVPRCPFLRREFPLLVLMPVTSRKVPHESGLLHFFSLAVGLSQLLFFEFSSVGSSTILSWSLEGFSQRPPGLLCAAQQRLGSLELVAFAQDRASCCPK